MHVQSKGDQWRITKNELVELLKVFVYYVLSGFTLGISIAPLAVNSGVLLIRNDNGLPLPARVITALIVVGIGILTALLAYCVLLPAELRLARQKLKPKLLAQRLAGKK